ncbi:MAG: hypothetical protein ABEI99_05210, partial [Halobaculum sp.]
LGALVGPVAVLAAVTRGPTELRETLAETLFSPASWGWQQYAAFTGYWLLIGYAFPTVFRLIDHSLVWPTIRLGTTVPAAVLYIATLVGLSGLVAVGYVAREVADVDRRTALVNLVVLHAVAGVGLILTDGLACAVWYDLIGFGTPAC